MTDSPRELSAGSGELRWKKGVSMVRKGSAWFRGNKCRAAGAAMRQMHKECQEKDWSS